MSVAHKALLTAKVTARSNTLDIIERLHIAFVADEVWTRGTTIRALEECSAAAAKIKADIDTAIAAYKAEVAS